MHRLRSWLVVFSFLFLAVIPSWSQSLQGDLPRLIRFSGSIKNSDGTPLTGIAGITFALYKEKEGGAPLWQEVQNVRLDSDGRYVIMLGQTSTEGLPLDVFSSGEARWLGVQVGGQQEQARALLVSVPYALKASDAQTLGGLPPSAFVMAPAASSGASGSSPSSSTLNPTFKERALQSAVSAFTSAGTTNFIGKFTNSTDLVNSAIFEDPNNLRIGIGTIIPGAKLEVNGGILLRGQVTHQVQMTGQASSGRLGQDVNGFFFASDTAGKSLRMYTTPTGGTLTPQLSILHNGLVGIGTTSPIERLEVNGNLLLRGQSYHQIQVISTGSGSRYGQDSGGTFIAEDTTDKVIRFLTSTGGGPLSNRMVITGSGNIGIGTNFPANRLSVVGVVESAVGGFKFPDSSIQAKAGITNVTGSSGLSGGGAPDAGGNVTLSADLTALQARVTGTCSSGTALGSIASNGSVSCNVISGGGGSLTLPFTGTGADNPPSVQGVFKVTNTANGPANTNQGPPDPSAVPGALMGLATGTGITAGVIGNATGADGVGVVGLNNSANAPAVVAWNLSTTGGDGLSAMIAATSNGAAVNGEVTAGTGSATAIEGKTSSASGWAGYFVNHANGNMLSVGNDNTSTFSVTGSQAQFQVPVVINGNLSVNGMVSKNGGSFKIDHPLDPADKFLSHSFVESPDMMNIYDGVAVLDRRGEAWVTLPNYFEALNGEYRYQLTAVGRSMPKLFIAQEIEGNRFKIAGGKAGAKVSWLVTGVRQDAWAKAHRIPVEEEKIGSERGTYMHPELFTNPSPMQASGNSGEGRGQK